MSIFHRCLDYNTLRQQKARGIYELRHLFIEGSLLVLAVLIVIAISRASESFAGKTLKCL